MSPKYFLIWLLSTTIFCLIVGLGQMFSREITLDNVRSFDFKIIHQSIKTNGFSNIKEREIKNLLDQLTIQNKKVVLFPLALLKNTHCIENGPGNHIKSICKVFNNVAHWEKLTKNIATLNHYGINFIEYKSINYIYEKLNSSTYLIGKAGNYLHFKSNGFKQLYFFISNRVPDYYLGSTYGIKKLLKKGGYSYIFIFFISGLLTFSFLFLKKRNQLKHINAIHALETTALDKDEKLNNILEKNSAINKQIRDLKFEKSTLENDNQLKNEENEYYVKETEKLEQQKHKLKQQLKDVEKQKEDLIEQKSNESSKISRKDLENELKLSQLQHNNLLKLWSSTTGWEQRRTIEEKVSKTNRLPFTLSTAFIAFERHIDESYDYLNKYDSLETPTLYEKINFISKNDSNLRRNLHIIRVSRNDWFHDGAAPKMGLIKELLILIDDEEPRV